MRVKAGLQLPESPNTVGVSSAIVERKRRRTRTNDNIVITLRDPRDGDINLSEKDVEIVGENDCEGCQHPMRVEGKKKRDIRGVVRSPFLSLRLLWNRLVICSGGLDTSLYVGQYVS